MNTLLELGRRSDIPGPVSSMGHPIKRVPDQAIIYRGQPLPALMHKVGGDRRNLEQFLRYNRVGNPFTLEEGRRLRVPKARSGFAQHPEA